MTHHPTSLRRLAAALWTLIVVVLLALPGDELPDPGPWDWLDKPVHAVLFGIHFALLARALAGGRRRLLAALASAAFAVVMEVAQLWVPGRGWEWWDLAAGFAGIAAAGVFLAGPRARLSPSS